MNNYYELLGVPYTANNEDIKKAHIQLLKKYHPDIFKGNKKIAEEFSARVNVAYSVLSSPTDRLKYDRSIFPISYSGKYYYDDSGRRVGIVRKPDNRITQEQYDGLPVFSFFSKSKFSEFFEFNNSLSTTQKMERRKKKKKQRLEKKKKKLESKIQKRKVSLKQEEKKIEKEHKDILKEFEKGKRKLDGYIIFITLILALIIGTIVALNIQNTI